MTMLVTNCLLNQPLDLGSGIYAEPLPDRLGLTTEVDYLLAIADRIGVDLSQMRESYRHPSRQLDRPCAIIHLPPIYPRLPTTPTEAQLERAYIACAALSALNTNSVDPIAYMVSWGDRAAVTIVHPLQVIMMGVSDQGYWQLGEAMVARALQDPRYSLLIQTFRVAQGIPHIRPDLRIVQYARIMEVAAMHMGYEPQPLGCNRTEERFKPVQRFIAHIGLSEQVETIPVRLDIAPLEAKDRKRDAIEVLFWMRNRVVHDGELTEAKIQAFDHALISSKQSIHGLAYQYESLIRNVLFRLTWPQFTVWPTAKRGPD